MIQLAGHVRGGFEEKDGVVVAVQHPLEIAAKPLIGQEGDHRQPGILQAASPELGATLQILCTFRVV